MRRRKLAQPAGSGIKRIIDQRVPLHREPGAACPVSPKAAAHVRFFDARLMAQAIDYVLAPEGAHRHREDGRPEHRRARAEARLQSVARTARPALRAA
jgi:hypothetical protein